MIGGTPSTRDRPRFYGGKHPWVKIKDISDAEGVMYLTETEDTITDAAVARYFSSKMIPKGTLLVSFKLSIGKVAIAGRDLYTNEAIAALIPKDDRVLPKYLYYILPRLDLAGPGARKASKGKTSSKGRLAEVRIPLPSIKTQKKIIAEMEKRDAEVEKYKKMIADLGAKGKKLIDRYAGI